MTVTGGGMRRFGAAERRARLGLRHRLALEARAGGPREAAEALVALHGTDAGSVFVSAWARMRGGDVASVERALYEDRELVRVMGMRRTVFVAAPPDAAVIAAACGRDVARGERRKLLATLADADPGPGAAAPPPGDPGPWLAEAEALVLGVLEERGEATAAEIAATDDRLQLELVLGRGTPREARQKVTGRILLVLAAEGRIVRARPRGSWTSTQFRWAPLEAWCPEAVPVLAAEEARAELARRWLRAFGPATEADLRWWTKWGARDTRAALAAAGTVDVELDGEPGVSLAGDLEPVAAPAPWVALLPALDPTTMGWAERGFYLGPHGPRLFDTTGNASPTVWCDGRVVGGWAHRPDGEVAYALLEDPGREAVAAIDAEAARLSAQLGDVRLAPRARRRSEVEAGLLA